MTEGQKTAIEQLNKISQASNGSFEIVNIPTQMNSSVLADVSIYCGQIPKTKNGIPLRNRERLTININDDFPFKVPSVHTRHRRFAGYPHVQWARHLCLYQAPQTEWNPSDGMYGFVDRLYLWLEKAAIAQLDPDDAPLHPPVAYFNRSAPLIISKKDTPEVADSPWIGKGVLKYLPNNRADIIDWCLMNESHQHKSAAAILLHKNLPFEYPSTVKGLIDKLEGCGISKKLLLTVLQLAVSDNNENDPLYVIVGTPMRGLRSGKINQHLAVWCIRPTLADGLRLCLNKYSENDQLKAIGEKCETIMSEWADSADIEWCKLREDRPEIVIRRDHESTLQWFKDKKVSIWGCGALGCQVAESLTRVGVMKLILHDNSSVAPGLLVRQLFEDADIGMKKSEVLAQKLQKIYPDKIEITSVSRDILDTPLGEDAWDEGVDVIIDTTANIAIAKKLELRRKNYKKTPPVLISMCVGHKAENAMVVISTSDHSGGPIDVLRSTRYELCNKGHRYYLEEFWPSEQDRRKTFQPEPGCSEATFIGSLADMATLSGMMLNCSARSIMESGASAYSHLLSQPHHLNESDMNQHLEFKWSRDIVLNDPHKGYEIRLANSAWMAIKGECARCKRLKGERVETGGILFGEEDKLLKVMWITEVLGPPPDSIQTDAGFICGKSGVAEANTEKRKRTRYTVSYLGMWHTHPNGIALPSEIDFEGMFRLLKGESEISKTCLMMIAGKLNSTPELGCYYFESEDFSTNICIRQCESRNVYHQRKDNNIGLSLSGGGSRAIAFHLGCLRALNDRGILDQVKVISTVSGGSVIGAMYAYSEDSFESFEKRVIMVLKEGLQLGIMEKFILKGGIIKAAGTLLLSGIPALIAKGANILFKKNIKPPFRRWSTRTTSFEQLLSERIYGDAALDDNRRDNIDVVINACELRTGSAFRFGSKESGCWRYGKLLNATYPVAKAVAASAAYPALLPALDESYDFINKQGEKLKERVILTDGGVFDNLGVTCMEPGKSHEYSYNVYSPEYIVCCNAGQGIFQDESIPFFWPSRMKRSFESVFRKVQDASFGRLHNYEQSGKLKGFVLPYLGQQDKYLPYIPPNLIRREQVYDYPTDFAPMSEESIGLLSDRGEQLTRILIDRYWYDL